MASAPAFSPPLRAAILPVTPLQQNCCLIWCTKTMRGAFTDPGGDLVLPAAVEIELDQDVGFVRLAGDPGGAHDRGP